MLKDGIFYSPKYEGRQVIMAPPRIAIFTNIHPDRIDEERIDKTRLIIHTLTES